MMTSIDSVAKFLQVYGGWGMCAVLLFGIFYLYKSMGKLLEKRNDQFIEVLKECGIALKVTSDSNKEVENLLRDNKALMERVERLLTKNDN